VAAGNVTLAPDVLRDYARRLLIAGGFRPEDARKTANLLVWANLRGVDSHGVLRIPRYVEMVERGMINAAATPRVVSEHGAVALVDADLAPGATGMELVSRKAVEIAGRMGVGLCVGRNVTHAGAVGYFAQDIVKAGLVGIVMTASKPLMAYPGAKGEAVSTNPLAIAAPSADAGAPIVLDMSTAAVALGKIMAAKAAGRPIPEGWGVDTEGRTTTDPAAVKALLPMAGHKGAGLSLMIEVLCSLLAGNPLIAPALAGANPPGFNGLVIAIDPGAFGDREGFLANVRSLASTIHALPAAAGGNAVLLPGERGRLIEAQRRDTGISLPPGIASMLSELASRLDVDAPVAATPIG
jgi:LDH2 family malate/lactate/ureidoglycolate dehydrogenase